MKPNCSGAPTTKTMGMVLIAASAASVAAVLIGVAMTSTRARKRSAASSGGPSLWPSDQRVSITGMISAFAEAAQDTAPEEMMKLLRKMGDVILQDPDVAAVATFTGSTGGAQTANTGRGFIVLKPRDERELTSSQIIDRLRPKLAEIEGATLFMQPTQDITVGGRIARASFQYTLQDSDIAELSEWSEKLLEKMRTLPELADVSSDLFANAPQLKITINRDQASRFSLASRQHR
jgi:multidrug efflux pump subunit AcrB